MKPIAAGSMTANSSVLRRRGGETDEWVAAKPAIELFSAGAEVKLVTRPRGRPLGSVLRRRGGETFKEPFLGYREVCSPQARR